MVIVMDIKQIDSKKMKKIIDNAVFREDKEYLEEINELFIEFMKENIDVIYNNEIKKLNLIPCTLTLDQKTIQIKFIYDRNSHSNSDFIKNAIKTKYYELKITDISSIPYSYVPDKKILLKDFFQTNDDIKVLESLKPIFNIIEFEPVNGECITATMKKYLKAEFEEKTKRDFKNLIMIQIKIIEDCSVIYDEMIEQVFIRNAKFIHPIYKCSNPAFTVSFKLASKSIFLTTLDQTQKANVETVKQEMITKIKEIFSNECTFKASYMFPLEILNECKAVISCINRCTKEMETVYSEEFNTDCDFSWIQLNEKDVPKCVRKQYALINYSFYFTSSENKADFEKKLLIEGSKSLQSNKCTINEWNIIEKSIKYPKNIEDELHENFCEFLKEKKKEILKSFLFIHFKPADQQIAIRGLESKINKFSKKSKNGECDELQLYGLANEFNQNKTSDKSIAITPEFIELIQNYPSVLYNSTTLKKFKKINMAKALKLEEDEYYKQDIFTQEIVNETICWFITLCGEVYWNLREIEDDMNEKSTIDIEFINFIENLFSFKARK